MANEKTKTATATTDAAAPAAPPAGEPMADAPAVSPDVAAATFGKRYVVAHGSIVLGPDSRLVEGDAVAMPAGEIAKLLEFGVIKEA